ncbi:MAG: 2-dehydro-3-deoxygalactonokinase [Geminicoccaceae bacterium]
MAAHREAALIGVDWGTSSLRAYLIGRDGEVLDELAADDGITRVTDKKFGPVLSRHLGAWLQTDKKLPVVASGMITSRQGWRETPYVSTPASSSGLADALLIDEWNGKTIAFVSGVSHRSEAGMPDVMRGEETQLLGLEPGDCLAVMPGTHSKWVRVKDQKIEQFSTFVTGELYEVLSRHSFVAGLTGDQVPSGDVFQRGLEIGKSDGAGLLNRLFACRTLRLFGELEEAELGDFLSGLIIGSELAEAQAEGYDAAGAKRVIVIANDRLTDLYRKAFAMIGVEIEVPPANIAARGQWRLASASGLIEGENF